MNNLKIIILLALLFIVSLYAQNEILEQRFTTAVETFTAADYETSESLFRSLRSTARSTEFFPITIYMQALSAYSSKDYALAMEVFREFLTSFTDHPYYYKANIYMGNCAFYLGDKLLASEYYVNALSSPYNNETILAQTSLKNLTWGYLTIDEINALLMNTPSKYAHEISWLKIKRINDLGRKAQAFKECNNFVKFYPKSKYVKEAQKLSAQLKTELSEKITIGVILPLTGDYSDFGQSVLNGIDLAFRQYSSRTSSVVEIIEKDSGGDPLRCVKSAEELFDTSSPLCLIGPLISEEAVALGALGKAHDVPIITPTASKSGLASISPNFYQIATSPTNAARKLIQYACDEMMMDTIAILAPDDMLGHSLAEVAQGVVDAKGKVHLITEYYQTDDVDFSTPISKIKEPILEVMDRRSVHASDSNYIYYNEDGSLKDRTEWLVHIDGVFVPGYIEELINILPQIPFNYIETKVLGANGWIVDELNNSDLRRYTDSCVFVPDQFYIDGDDKNWENFERAYQKEFGSAPDRLAAFGYDAAQLVCNGISDGAITPDMLNAKLHKTSNYIGVTDKINFDSNGANTESRIYMFEGRNLEKIE